MDMFQYRYFRKFAIALLCTSVALLLVYAINVRKDNGIPKETKDSKLSLEGNEVGPNSSSWYKPINIMKYTSKDCTIKTKESRCDPSVISVNAMGKLCNKIFEYMSLYVVWKENQIVLERSNFKPYIEDCMKHELEQLFDSVSIGTFKECRRKTVKLVTERCIPNEGSALIPNVETGWYQLESYSARYEAIINFGLENINRELRFKQSTVEQIQVIMDGIIKKRCPGDRCIFIGMHYRGGDYINHMETIYGSRFKGPPDYRYYVTAMNYFKEIYENPIFILITADSEWLEANGKMISENGNVVVNPTQVDVVKDLVLLSHCNNSIINYGTFGVISALFANGTTIVYNLYLPIDNRGQTVGLAITQLLPKKWFTGNDTKVALPVNIGS